MIAAATISVAFGAGCTRSVDDATTPATSTSSTSTTTAHPQLSVTTTTVEPPPTTAATRELAGAVIVVDPGHNGANGSHPTEINRLVDAGGFQKACNTTGTAEGAITESRVNWETAQVLRRVLEARGATVVLTRASDDGWGPCVDQRGLTAQRANADLLISIHADGAAPSASGFHVIWPAVGPTVSAATGSTSAELAGLVRDALVAQGLSPAAYVGGDHGVVERADIATVNRAGVPAVMVECGNMHNADDLAVLASPAGRSRLAAGLAEAIDAFIAAH